MFFLLHECLITDFNTEKDKKYCQRNINYNLENLFVQDMYVIFFFLNQYFILILTTNLAACVCVFVCAQNFTNFSPHALISSPNVPKILVA